jgi:hypothetical protein
MARLAVIEFNPKKPLFVRRAFVANGRRYEPGQEFAWGQMALSLRKVRNMFEAGLLRHAAVAQPMAVVVEPAEPVVSEPVAVDDLDGLDLHELRKIADEIGAPYKRSKDEQREAIRLARGDA